MGRPVRIHLPDIIFHILNRGNNRQEIFRDSEDYHRYLSILRKYKKKFQFKIFAYCLMSNHVHLLIKTSEAGNVSDIMKAQTISHTRHYHIKYKSSGHVWQGRFKSPIVSDDEYLFSVMQYIEQNPVRAGIADRPGGYSFSSYDAHTQLDENELVDREENPIFMRLGSTLEERIAEYSRLSSRGIDKEKTELIRASLGGQNQFSSKSFLIEIDGKLAAVEKKRRGRPRKMN